MKALIRSLTEAWGPSGHEDRVREVIADLVADHVDEQQVDAMGNLITRCRPADDVAGASRIMLAAHMDEIGVIVTHVDDDGFLRFATVGGVLVGNLIGVRVQFEDGTVGVVGSEKRSSRSKAPRIDELFIDIGAPSKDDVGVEVGDVASFRHTLDWAGERPVAPNMDDRIGCAVLVETLRRLEPGPCDVYGVFTVQEEIGLRGATTSAYGVAPDAAVAIDVTLTGDTPEAATMSVTLGKGPAVKVKDRGMIAHRGLRAALERAAERVGVAVQHEVLTRGTTDARSIQTSRAGVPAGTLSIPSRYVHTPSQMVDLADVAGAVEVLVALLSEPLELS